MRPSRVLDREPSPDEWMALVNHLALRNINCAPRRTERLSSLHTNLHTYTCVRLFFPRTPCTHFFIPPAHVSLETGWWIEQRQTFQFFFITVLIVRSKIASTLFKLGSFLEFYRSYRHSHWIDYARNIFTCWDVVYTFEISYQSRGNLGDTHRLFYSSSGCGKAQSGKLFLPGRAVRSFYFVTGYLPKWCNVRRLVRHARVYIVRVPITQRLESNYINCGGHLVTYVSIRLLPCYS